MSPSNRHWKPTKAAERDLEEIWRYTFGRWSIAQADSYHNTIVGTFIELAAGRRQGRKFTVPGRAYLYYPVGSHNIFFREEKTRIVIVRILHSRIDPARHL